MKDRRRSPWPIVAIVIVVVALPVIYAGAYLAMLTRSHWIAFDADGYLLPEYRFGGAAVETVFYPAYRVDRMIRPEHWGGWDEDALAIAPPAPLPEPEAMTDVESIEQISSDPDGEISDEDQATILAMLGTVLAEEPNNVDVLLLRGSTYELQGQWELALADYSAAREAAPKDFRPASEAARLLAACPDDSLRNGEKAVQLAQRACELSDWKEPLTIATLAAAYAELGDWEAAVDMQKTALAGLSKEIKLAEEYKAALAGYEKRQPHRLPAPSQ